MLPEPLPLTVLAVEDKHLKLRQRDSQGWCAKPTVTDEGMAGSVRLRSFHGVAGCVARTRMSRLVDFVDGRANHCTRIHRRSKPADGFHDILVVVKRALNFLTKLLPVEDVGNLFIQLGKS